AEISDGEPVGGQADRTSAESETHPRSAPQRTPWDGADPVGADVYSGDSIREPRDARDGPVDDADRQR
ncbi:MAG: hypothetical protein SW019_17170, partial [Actinomycetota bacterium]|nr:hypothetical protein [Actinomycetota bacterium]